MNDNDGPVPIVPIDDASAPVFFVDQLIGAGPIAARDGVANLVFGVQLWDHSENPPRPYLKTNLRLIMPVASLKQALEFAEQTIGKPGIGDHACRPAAVLLQ
jgi:hypothetical protein